MSELSVKLASGNPIVSALESYALTEAIGLVPTMWAAVKDEKIGIHVHVLGIPINVDVPISSLGGIEQKLVDWLTAKQGAVTVQPAPDPASATPAA